MKKNKVLFITTKAITQNIFFKEFIKNNPFDLTLGCSDIKNLEFTKKKIQFNFTSNIWKLLNPFLFLFIIFKNRKKIINENFKVIIINNPLASFYIRLSLLFSNQKIMYFVHGYRFHNSEINLKYYIYYFLEKILSKCTSFFININRDDFLITKKNFKIPSKKILFLPSVGINFKKLKKLKKLKKIKNNSQFKIGVIAAYRDNKGYKELIEISEFLYLKKINVIIECFGYDSFEKYKEVVNIKKIKNIKFNKFTKNIHKNLKGFDLLCHLSKREGMPISIIESIFLGVPVIGYKIRGNRDIIKHNFNGYLINPYDLNRFKIFLCRIVSGKININLTKKNCRPYNIKKHDQTNINHKLIRFILNAC